MMIKFREPSNPTFFSVGRRQDDLAARKTARPSFERLLL